jgi:hypothetical protein
VGHIGDRSAYKDVRIEHVVANTVDAKDLVSKVSGDGKGSGYADLAVPTGVVGKIENIGGIRRGTSGDRHERVEVCLSVDVISHS